MDTVAPMDVQEDGANADDESSESEEKEEEERGRESRRWGKGGNGKGRASSKPGKPEVKPPSDIKYRGVCQNNSGWRAIMRHTGGQKYSDYFNDPADAARAHDDYFRERYTHPVVNFLDDGRLNPHRNDGAKHQGKIDRPSSQGSEDADRDTKCESQSQEFGGGGSQASDGPRWGGRARRAKAVVINMADIGSSDVEDLYTQAKAPMTYGDTEEEEEEEEEEEDGEKEEEEEEEGKGKAAKGKGARTLGRARAGKRKGKDQETGGAKEEEGSPAKKGRRNKGGEGEEEAMDEEQGGALADEPMDLGDGPIDHGPTNKGERARPKRACVKAEQPLSSNATVAKPAARRKAPKATGGEAQGGGGGGAGAGAGQEGGAADTKAQKQPCSVEEAISSLRPLAYNAMHSGPHQARYRQLAKLLGQPTPSFRVSVRDFFCQPDSVFDVHSLLERTRALDFLLDLYFPE